MELFRFLLFIFILSIKPVDAIVNYKLSSIYYSNESEYISYYLISVLIMSN